MNQNPDRIFTVFTILSVLLFGALIVENTITMQSSVSTRETIDLESVKRKLNESGLKPIEARHWIEVKGL